MEWLQGIWETFSQVAVPPPRWSLTLEWVHCLLSPLSPQHPDTTAQVGALNSVWTPVLSVIGLFVLILLAVTLLHYERWVSTYVHFPIFILDRDKNQCDVNLSSQCVRGTLVDLETMKQWEVGNLGVSANSNGTRSDPIVEHARVNVHLPASSHTESESSSCLWSPSRPLFITTYRSVASRALRLDPNYTAKNICLPETYCSSSSFLHFSFTSLCCLWAAVSYRCILILSKCKALR